MIKRKICPMIHVGIVLSAILVKTKISALVRKQVFPVGSLQRKMIEVVDKIVAR
jgi:hypothetical protein